MRLRYQVGINITRLRGERNMTKVYVAKHSGIDASNLTKIESGKQALSVDLVEKLAAVLEVEPALLFAKPVSEGEQKIAPAPESVEHLKSLLNQALETVKSMSRKS